MHLRRIGTVWQEDTRGEGFLENDPSGIAFYRIRSSIRVDLGDRPAETVKRDEFFRMRNGAEFQCQAEGNIEVSADYAWNGTEVRVRIDNRPARLVRSCRPSGFPQPTKDIGASSTTFALRHDKLVAVSPPRARSVLIPVQ